MSEMIAIDPGPTESAYVLFDGERLIDFGKVGNARLLELLHLWRNGAHIQNCAIEQIKSYGMAVGAEIFETCVWTGRFMQQFGPERCDRIPRMTVKVHLCGSSKAKDANIRQALIDRFGGSAAIKKGGPLYKVSKDTWAALAVAVTWWDRSRLGLPVAG